MRFTRGLSEDGKSQTIHKLENLDELPGVEGFEVPKGSLLGMYLDIETTGLDYKKDKIIDFAYIIFEFSIEDGTLISIRKQFEQLEDPGFPLEPNIVDLTGITDADLQGKSLDRDAIAMDISHCSVIIAHNAQFDRSFVTDYIPEATGKLWLCSMAQIPWKKLGHSRASLDMLSRDHGYFFEGHRALVDCIAGVKLLISGKIDDTSYLKTMMEDIKRPYCHIIAEGSSFGFKDELRKKGFRWSPEARQWYYPNIDPDSDLFHTIREFLEANTDKGAGTMRQVSVKPGLRFERFENLI